MTDSISQWHPKPPMLKGRPDDFQTPAYALTPLLPYIKKDWVVWECASGIGLLSRELARRGHRVISTDILTGTDFIRSPPPKEWGVIITNPPYTLKDAFLERCYTLGKPFALLLPITSLEGRNRQRLFAKYGVEIIIMDRRINFETPDGTGGGAWFMTAWFTFGLNIGNQLTFTTVRPAEQLTIAEG